MKFIPRSLVVLAALGCALAPAVRADAPPAPKKILFFSKSSGFEHEAIKLKLKDGRPGYAFAVLRKIGDEQNIIFTFSKDGSLFTPGYLAQFDAFFFYTTGDLTLARNDDKLGDGNPPMTAAGKAALLAAVKGGKGFIGTHSATDTFHSPGNKDHGPARNQPDGDRTDPYAKMLGAEFIQHNSQQAARQIVIDRKFPGMSQVPDDFGPLEEWYSLKDFAPDIHVLLVQDTTKMKDPSYARPPYPSTWARMDGKGRVFYTSMGHREDIWNSPVFQAVLVGGINWSLGRVNADITPNIKTAAPGAYQLPVYIEPPPPKPAKPVAATAP